MAVIVLEPFLGSARIGEVFLGSEVHGRFTPLHSLITDYWLRAGVFEQVPMGYKLLRQSADFLNLPGPVLNNEDGVIGNKIPILAPLDLVAIELVDGPLTPVTTFKFKGAMAFMVYSLKFVDALGQIGSFSSRRPIKKNRPWILSHSPSEPENQLEVVKVASRIMSMIVKVEVDGLESYVSLSYRLSTEAGKSWYLGEVANVRVRLV